VTFFLETYFIKNLQPHESNEVIRCSHHNWKTRNVIYDIAVCLIQGTTQERLKSEHKTLAEKYRGKIIQKHTSEGNMKMSPKEIDC
jgi:hypothetical protein